MTWCNDCSVASDVIMRKVPSSNDKTMSCPSCGHQINRYEKARIHDLPGLPAGVKFDPSDQEILEHLEAKVRLDAHKLHPLIDEFIPTLEGENGICYTHPEKLPDHQKHTPLELGNEEKCIVKSMGVRLGGTKQERPDRFFQKQK
ncbi:hypothetical protein M8C21_029121 [Ambrosia artemisiifolia]|uniref:NAC domain-containing protein n=1 Tax=Ambrosia artemisiifolia TaxID=4212 RepID=A0AAD5DH03_AMBAR|nr:hypothetical protein M8C21_029121 [Ambrosia artemisiifolia]